MNKNVRRFQAEIAIAREIVIAAEIVIATESRVMGRLSL